MAQGGPQLDYHMLQELKKRFPEIPESVVSQCLLQNNNNLEVCCHLLAQESSRYLYEEYHSPEEVHLSRNRMLHISVGGYAPAEGGNSNSNAGYNTYFIADQGRSANTPTPPPTVPGISPTYTPVPHRYMTPITLALSPNIPNAPQALQIPSAYANSGNALYMRPSPSQSPQPSPWASSNASVYPPSPYSTPTYQSPYSSPQHHAFLPISPPTLPTVPYQHVSYRPYMPSKSSMKNQIEITLEARQRSNSPIHTNQGDLYMPTSPSPSSPSRAVGMAGPPGASFHPGVYLGGARPRPASSPQAGSSAYLKMKMGPGQQQQQLGSGSPSPPVETESLLNIVDQGEKHGTPAPILPILAVAGSGATHVSHMPRRSSSGSDDYAYTQALLLHQRARMERLMKELLAERQKLEQLKAEVNDMEYDALQRRFRRVNSSSFIPRPEEMTRFRTLNRQLQIDIDCTLKETDLLQSRGKFDPKAMNNFYDNIQPGPVVPPKSEKRAG
ncbi:TGF-beta-activated kinase 1 and MAP3K7-binding protein 3 isoform X2 [Trichomycterus rosablanca]|uniref:TGF-beta-activated kinase 1 and MAP3K7-binding protein 3 isoform X2 n=1 Tax=Trichomycterus rosablanca TaxID=2290929 RepID=UPI002F35F6CF